MTRALTLAAVPPLPAATRRGLFGITGAMLLLSAAEAGPAKAAELDGELLACCAEVLAIDRESDRLWSIIAAMPDDSADEAPHVAYEAFSDSTTPRWSTLVARICTLPARTPEGLRAKAEVGRNAVPFERREEPDPVDRLAWSVLGDILGSAGA